VQQLAAIIAFVVVGLLASPAFASSEWYRQPGSTDAADKVTSIGPGESAYFQETETGTTDSKILDLSGCVSWTGLVVNSASGVGTGYFMHSLTADGSLGTEDGGRVGVAANSAKILNDAGDLDMTGDEATGLAHMWGAPHAHAVWFDVTAQPGGTETLTVMISCSIADTSW
jgi:hypothetical protein